LSHVRSNIVQKLVRLIKYLWAFNEDGLVRHALSSVINLRLMGSRIEGSIINLGEKLAVLFSKLQRSTEESLFMSSMYMGLLLTMALTAMVVLIYAIR